MLSFFRCFAPLSAVIVAGCMSVQPMENVGLPPATLTPGMIAAAEQAVSQNLKDPYSAQYQGMRAFRKDNATFAVCGFVNGKNSYGGYVGYVPFVAYVAAGVNQKAGQYFSVGATVAHADDADGFLFYQLVPLCRA